MKLQELFMKNGNPPLSRGSLAESGRDVEQNLIAETSACLPTTEYPEHFKDRAMKRKVPFANHDFKSSA